jgi:hypothetical protein
VTNLQLKRAIAKSSTSLNALTATVTQLLINLVLKIGILHKLSFDGTGRAKLILGSCGKVSGLGAEIASAKVAVTTHTVNVHALNRRRRFYAASSALSTLNALSGVELPNHLLRRRFSEKMPNGCAQTNGYRKPESTVKELASVHLLSIAIIHTVHY